MSISSWQDLKVEHGDMETNDISHLDGLSQHSPLTNKKSELTLNFDRFNSLSIDYSSSHETSLLEKVNNEVDCTSNKTQVSPPDNSPLPASPSSVPSFSTPLVTTQTNHKRPSLRHTTYSTSLSTPSIVHNIRSPADTFASWTAPRVTNAHGAALPWLSPFTDNHNTNNSTIDRQAALRKWESMHRKPERQNEVGRNSTSTPSPPPSDDDLESIPQQQQQPSGDTLLSNKLSNIFYFCSMVEKSKAMESVMSRISEQVTEKRLWHTVRFLDLSHQHLTAIHRLDTLMPRLEALIIANNQIHELSCLPVSLKSLQAQSNRLTDIEGFRSLHKLEFLDISDNALTTFDGIESFYYLHTIMAENNKIKSCSALQKMYGLVTLKLRGNTIEQLKFEGASLYQLKSLDVSYNRIRYLENLEGLPKLQELNLDKNDIELVTMNQPVTTLRALRMSYNRLRVFDAQLFPALQVLYLDNNQLVNTLGLQTLHPLDSISLRDQAGQPLQINIKDLQQARKLYLSGHPLKQISSELYFDTLEYLELCSVHMVKLPADFAKQVPQVRALYLSHNYLDDISGLHHHPQLQRLVLIDNRLKKLGNLLEVLRTLPQLYSLDIRNNPINFKLYDDIVYTSSYTSANGNVHPLCRYIGPEHDTSWLSRDAAFYQHLPQHWRLRRNMYRSLFITECCSTLGVLDNIVITTEERESSCKATENYIRSKQQEKEQKEHSPM